MQLPKNVEGAFYNIPVPVSAHWRGHALTLRELQSLEVGDVLLLDPKACEKAVIDLGNLPKFSGKVAREGKQVRVTISSKIE